MPYMLLPWIYMNWHQHQLIMNSLSLAPTGNVLSNLTWAFDVYTIAYNFNGQYRICRPTTNFIICMNIQADLSPCCSIMIKPWEKGHYAIWKTGMSTSACTATQSDQNYLHTAYTYTTTFLMMSSELTTRHPMRIICITNFSDKIAYANSGDPDQTAPLGAVWSGSTLFVIPPSFLRKKKKKYRKNKM